MCAISGIYKKPGHNIGLKKYLERMLEIQHHRGPDAQGLWLSKAGGVGFAHNRLSILDLSEAGNQPMHSPDGDYSIVFNGEIYNYRELHQQLKAKGSLFRTHSDTEILIEAYRHWGETMLHHLRGMFAFALYDHADGSIFCARDRVGKKPFVYAQTSGGFVFASEIPAVRQVEGVDAGYDHDAIAAMLLHNLRHIPDPHTAYRGIKRLRAGHAMRVRQGTIENIWRYWTPTQSNIPTTPQHLRTTLQEAIALRMRADVPVGALLSGGIDSSAIVAMMQEYVTQPIHTYALGLDRNDEDLRRAKLMAQQLGTIHKEFYFDPEEQWRIFNQLIATYGEPIMLLPLVHTYTLCRAIRDDGVKVVLSGNGADELFYGYSGHINTLRISQVLDKVTPLRSILKPLKYTRLSWLAVKPGARKAAFYNSIARSTWKHCLSNVAIDTFANRAAEELEYWGQLCPSGHYIDESNFVGLMVENTHSVTIAGDLPAMAASIEIRSPFLDQEVIDFALATPAELKIPDINNKDWLKAILRDSVHDLLPESLLKAPKRGFGSGIQEADLLRGAWRDRAEEVMESPNLVGGLFNKARIQQQWKGFLNGDVVASQVAKQLALQCWLCGTSG
ncbi:asparagine synthase (glutamine-hydrolyzing) [Endozoicomonas sp. YOMI1]|uniref:asparagine synthase (glutamine-hydrolyzing) n=1 Tax=Endozoicomonas sp. YOMI1 TaxID=2828739 RepID=UPI002148A135|nr:asparagine synthase (glutamine-hydrolyzing) [Endozoicomonas sp. YOMI1]